jgi:hypothetical protein
MWRVAGAAAWSWPSAAWIALVTDAGAVVAAAVAEDGTGAVDAETSVVPKSPAADTAEAMTAATVQSRLWMLVTSSSLHVPGGRPGPRAPTLCVRGVVPAPTSGATHGSC